MYYLFLNLWEKQNISIKYNSSTFIRFQEVLIPCRWRFWSPIALQAWSLVKVALTSSRLRKKVEPMFRSLKRPKISHWQNVVLLLSVSHMMFYAILDVRCTLIKLRFFIFQDTDFDICSETLYLTSLGNCIFGWVKFCSWIEASHAAQQ